jgi:hypothetical protein
VARCVVAVLASLFIALLMPSLVLGHGAASQDMETGSTLLESSSSDAAAAGDDGATGDASSDTPETLSSARRPAAPTALLRIHAEPARPVRAPPFLGSLDRPPSGTVAA